ncbi:hypothetical protein [Agrobacterium deltaense]|nr:hypothetical protein [Agrobacterium deltaense]
MTVLFGEGSEVDVARKIRVSAAIISIDIEIAENISAEISL